MNRTTMRPLGLFVALCLVVTSSVCHAWGYAAHRLINGAAVTDLPPDMRGVVIQQQAALAEHGPDPDLWKADPAERSRHFIDLELGDRTGPPFSHLPRDYAGAVRALGADSVKKMGTLPWQIQAYFDKLVRSMRRPSDSTWVIMAALGHYVADAHMPMHATINYDGQLTGNRGIHFRFEWWMLDPHLGEIKTALAPYVPFWAYDPLDVAWRILLASYADIDTLLAADTAARTTFRPPIDAPDGRRQPDPQYDERLWARLGGIAERRMDMSAQAVAGYWYAAWLKAGRPDLRRAPAPPPPPPEE